MGIAEILRRIWLFSANKIKTSQSVSKQPTQLIIELNSSSQQKLGTKNLKKGKYIFIFHFLQGMLDAILTRLKACE